MMKVRKLLTEILLDVTSDELVSVAKQVCRKAKLKAAKGITSLVLHHPKYSLLTGHLDISHVADCQQNGNFGALAMTLLVVTSNTSLGFVELVALQ